MNSCQYVVNAKMPDYILVAEKPLNLGGIPKRVSHAKFEERFKLILREGVSCDKNADRTLFKKEALKCGTPSTELVKQVEKVLSLGYEEYLVICNGECGCSLFASKNISKDTVIAIYSGTLASVNPYEKGDDFSYGFYGSNIRFSSHHYRGIASFLQHLPKEPAIKDVKKHAALLKTSEEELKVEYELHCVEFDSQETKEKVATENVSLRCLKYKNFPLLAVVTKVDIKAGEQLGFDYGQGYWWSRKTVPEFFDKNGSVLPPCKRTYGGLTFDIGMTNSRYRYAGEYKPFLDLLKKRISPVTIVGDDNKTYKVCAGHLFLLLLAARACTINLDLYDQLREELPQLEVVAKRAYSLSNTQVLSTST